MRIYKLMFAMFESLIVIVMLTLVLPAVAEELPDPAEITIGERLFLETRFAQAYYANPKNPDPSVSHTLTTGGLLPGPFSGKRINCRSCHMVDEHQKSTGGGMRTYADFAALTPVPARNDGKKVTGRNSMSMVNVSIPRKRGELFHFDGEFNSLEDLIRATLTGRNFGWLPGESQIATAHIARVIREDDGMDELASEFGGNYRKVLMSSAKDLDTKYTLPAPYRINVDQVSDQQILDTVTKLIAAYLRDLSFSLGEDGHYDGSPYDHFLLLNNLPRAPEQDEKLEAYNQRLLQAVIDLKAPKFITEKDGKFIYHEQAFNFGEQELAGMKLFFSRGGNMQRGGNCAACHQAPHFSDYSFHNTGLTQVNYDGLHGTGKFMQLGIPDLTTRNQDYNRYLPATAKHPDASSQYRSTASINGPGVADLGLWNVFANPDMPGPQAKLNKIMCSQLLQTISNISLDKCTPEHLLTITIASFKTPVLRDLGHSNPYMHTGQFNKLVDAVNFYITNSTLARQHKLLNGDLALQNIYLEADDIDALVSFIKALNEDYD